MIMGVIGVVVIYLARTIIFFVHSQPGRVVLVVVPCLQFYRRCMLLLFSKPTSENVYSKYLKLLVTLLVKHYDKEQVPR
jgi:hypothetical protein